VWKKNVYGSREQYTGPIDKHILVQNLLVKEAVGPVHSAQDPLTGNIPRETLFSIKKEKRNANAKTLPRNAIQTLPKLYKFKLWTFQIWILIF